jgi:hypothetical protein
MAIGNILQFIMSFYTAGHLERLSSIGSNQNLLVGGEINTTIEDQN